MINYNIVSITTLNMLMLGMDKNNRKKVEEGGDELASSGLYGRSNPQVDDTLVPTLEHPLASWVKGHLDGLSKLKIKPPQFLA